MLYFAYGSNMSSRRLLARTASARIHSIATLHEHELKFHKVSLDGSGKCDVVPCAQKQSQVHGVVYQIASSDITRLDTYEGLGKGYDKKFLTVTSQSNQALQVMLYSAIHTDPLMQPYHWYKQHVLIGAKENNLPRPYIQHIEQIESITDLDTNRHQKELKIYL